MDSPYSVENKSSPDSNGSAAKCSSGTASGVCDLASSTKREFRPRIDGCTQFDPFLTAKIHDTRKEGSTEILPQIHMRFAMAITTRSSATI